jgi:hypothetical protein
MTSVFNQIFIAIQNKILTEIPDSTATPGIRYIEIDMGQLENYSTRPAVSFPCLLIDYTSTTYLQRQHKAQWGEMLINFKLAFDTWGNSSSLSSEELRKLALRYYEIENKIYLALQDWNAEGLLMQPLKRVSASSEKREDNFRVRDIVFKATYEDRGLQLLP